MKLAESLRIAEERLKQAGVDSPRLEAQVLAAFSAGQTRSWILAHTDSPTPESFWDALDRREEREPLAYITGVREFYGRPFRVNSSVLIPRQESELIVEAAKEHLLSGHDLLDVGTGAGCLAITLSLEIPDSSVTALDISEQALEVAAYNARALGATVPFIRSDFLSGLPQDQLFDVIVSNPPYVVLGEISQPEVRDWEPPMALYAGETGMDAYRTIARQAPDHLRPGGILIFEIGDGRWPDMQKLFTNPEWKILEMKKDLDGHPRVLVLKLKSEPLP